MAPGAPWKLSGSAHVVYMRGGSVLAPQLLMLVRYSSSPVGPYDELLYCHRRLFGKRGRWSVDAIVVSSEDSVQGGRANWGLPKQLGAFDIRDAGGGSVSAKVSIAKTTEVFADMQVRGFGPSVAVSSRFLPARLLSFAQLSDGTRFDFTPRLSCRVRPGAVARLDVGAPFPRLRLDDVRGAVHLPTFSVEFPVAQTRPERP